MNTEEISKLRRDLADAVARENWEIALVLCKDLRDAITMQLRELKDAEAYLQNSRRSRS